MKIKIVLVRHGYSLGNKEDRLSGWTDVPLTQEGVKELETLRQKYHYPETDFYFSSDLQRAYHTAQIIYPNAKIEKLPKFREINFGIYENKSSSEVNFEEFFESWLSESEIKQGENYFQFRERILSAIHDLNLRLIKKGITSYTLVSHSGIIRVLYIFFLEKEHKDFFQIPVPNGLGYELEIEYASNQFQITSINPLRKKI